MPTDPEFTEVFISHSSKDASLAAAIAKFLHECLMLKAYEIACTSAVGFGLPIGAKYEEQVRKIIQKCHVFVSIVSNDSLASLFCTMEIGAAWGRKKPLKFVLAPGIRVQDLQSPISNFHVVHWTDMHAWIQLANEGCRGDRNEKAS